MPFPDYLSDFLNRIESMPHPNGLASGNDMGVPDEPEHMRLSGYMLRTIDKPPTVLQREVRTVEDARTIARDAMLDYANEVNPKYMLLVRMAAGSGKSHIAAGVANHLAERQRRVLWAAPRHDYIHDLRALSAKQGYNPNRIYEWQPRQEGNEAKGTETNCTFVDPINDWMARGYEAKDFCARICGWEYMQNQCKYHAQKSQPHPIIMGVHQHVVLGHPLAESFGVLIGDESPLSTFINQWRIPARFILPAEMDMSDPLAEILHGLQGLAEKKDTVEGEELMRLLGGARYVLRAVKDFTMSVDMKRLVPPIRTTSDVERVPYYHLPSLVPLLHREAHASAEGTTYAHRIIVGNGALMLMLRRNVDTELPSHVIWLDATGDEHLYQEMFRREVRVVEPYIKPKGRIVQIVGRSNNKTSLVGKNDDGETIFREERVDQLAAQVEHIIRDNKLQAPGLITYKAVSEAISRRKIPNLSFMHFYAARGANGMENVDGLIVAGTPQPNLFQMDALARMLYFDRDEQFDRTFTHQYMPYYWQAHDGTGREYPASGFWFDPDLQTILWQQREAEIIQSVNRARILNRNVTVWLLASLPIKELPPTELVELRDLMRAPMDTDIFLWAKASEVAHRAARERGFVTTLDLVEELGIDRRTAWKYIEYLAAQEGWDLAAIKGSGRGRPTKAAQPRNVSI